MSAKSLLGTLMLFCQFFLCFGSFKNVINCCFFYSDGIPKIPASELKNPAFCGSLEKKQKKGSGTGSS